MCFEFNNIIKDDNIIHYNVESVIKWCIHG